MIQRQRFQVACDPRCTKNVLHQFAVVIINGLQIKMRRPTGMMGVAMLVDLNKLQTAGGDGRLMLAADAPAFTDAVIYHEQHFGFSTVIVGVNQYRPLFQLAAMSRQDQVSGRSHQWMVGMDKIGHGFTRHTHPLFFKADALVLLQYRSAGFSHNAIVFSNRCRDVTDLISA